MIGQWSCGAGETRALYWAGAHQTLISPGFPCTSLGDQGGERGKW